MSNDGARLYSVTFPEHIDWDALRAPFDPREVDFRIQGNPSEGKTSARVVAYIDARTVQDRLDTLVGPMNWAFDWTPIVIKGDAVIAAKGTLTICGVSKSDVGDPGNTEPSKASVSDALKRAAVQWGIGRYLYDLGTQWGECTKQGNTWVLAKGEVEKLRAKLPKPTTAMPLREDAPQEDLVTDDQWAKIERGCAALQWRLPNRTYLKFNAAAEVIAMISAEGKKRTAKAEKEGVPA